MARSGDSDEVCRKAEALIARVAQSDLFVHDREILVARAPGRLDVIGGIADYSGSLVLEWPIAEATFVAIQRDPRPTLVFVSRDRMWATSVQQLLSLGYPDALAHFSADPKSHWTAYVAGAFIVLAHECNAHFTEGARILITSSVPEGKGVSSSAALEVAAMTAIAAAYGISLEPRQLALLCQKVENLVAGAPCGAMDQMTASLGESGRLLALLCQPAELYGTFQLPSELAFWGIDSGVRHAVTGTEYGVVRAATFMGRRILEGITGRDFGYLTNVTPEEFSELSDDLPERMSGREFLDRFGGTADPLSTIDPDRVYPVRGAASHPVHEHVRARTFAELLSQWGNGDSTRTATGEDRASRLGALMYESHESYSACGLGSGGTDALVRLLRRAGARAGVYGAKITGGGRGGTVAVLSRADSGPLVNTIATEYAHRCGIAPRVFGGSSSGSAAWGVCTVRR